MTRFFTSDLHFGHANIISYSDRPFADVDQMNTEIIERWNSTVGDDDEVWVLGDVCMGKIAETLPMCELLNGRKKLVPGNHDRCWTGHRKVGTWPERYAAVGFEVMPPHTSLFLGDEDTGFTLVDICHFPYQGDSHDSDRFDHMRPTDQGRWLLHGHVHEKWKVNGRMINVGADVWDFRPVPETALLEVIHGKSG